MVILEIKLAATNASIDPKGFDFTVLAIPVNGAVTVSLIVLATLFIPDSDFTGVEFDVCEELLETVFLAVAIATGFAPAIVQSSLLEGKKLLSLDSTKQSSPTSDFVADNCSVTVPPLVAYDSVAEIQLQLVALDADIVLSQEEPPPPKLYFNDGFPSLDLTLNQSVRLPEGTSLSVYVAFP
ncbi:hypothetical protein KC960_02580 [Candidatus Saccharibacteria bacterium]|nr:hypothetical protein [Candidatus Saccharibacteria bacterium]